MKSIYSSIFILTLMLSSCVNDLNSGQDNSMTQTHGYDSETAGGIDTGIEKSIKESENPERNNWQKPREVIRRLGNLDGKAVADIGAGSGYFSFQMLPSAGKVIAIDIDQKALDQIDVYAESLPEEWKGKLETRLVDYDNPKLANEEVDIVFIANTYAYIDEKVEYLKTVYQGLKPGGRICIVDFKMKKLPAVFPLVEDRTPLFEVERELEAAGFRHLFSDDQTLDYQYIVIAKKE